MSDSPEVQKIRFVVEGALPSCFRLSKVDLTFSTDVVPDGCFLAIVQFTRINRGQESNNWMQEIIEKIRTQWSRDDLGVAFHELQSDIDE